MTKVCFSALPRPAFQTLQKRVFPIYFWSQSSLILLTVISYPPFGPWSLLRSSIDMLTLAIASVTALANLIKYGPGTRQTMIERSHQGRNARSEDMSSF